MDISILNQLDASTLRQVLPGYLSSYFANNEASAANRARLTKLVAAWRDTETEALLQTLSILGEEMRLYPADPCGRSLSRSWSRDAITSWNADGLEHLKAASDAGPVIILCNHLSYYDATATDAVIAWAGHQDIADRLLFAAGPKVYKHMFRRVAAGCLNTVKVPQSTRLAHTERVSMRDLARQATSSLQAAAQGMTKDRLILLLYPEGSRTRDGHMGSFLKGVHRYLSSVDGIAVVPMTVEGTDLLMSVDNDERIVPGAIHLSFMPPLHVGPDGASRDILGKLHGRIGAALPPNHRPQPGTPALV